MRILFLFLAVLLANTAFAQIQPSESNDLDAAKYRIATEEEQEALAQKGLHVVTTHDNGLPANYRILTEEERIALLKHKELTIVTSSDEGLPDDWVEVSIEEREALASKGMQIIIKTDDGLPDDWEFADEATIAKLVEAGYWKENASTKTGAWADGQAGSMESEGEYTLIRRKSDPKQYAIVCQKNDGVLEICCIRKLF